MKDYYMIYIYEVMRSRIKKISSEKYIYANKIVFPKIEGKTPLVSFFTTFPILASEYFNQISDEIHPF